MEYIKSPLNYMGCKYKLLPQIISLLPNDIDVFVDLFCGGLDVGVNVRSNKVIANDNLKPIISMFRTFKKLKTDFILESVLGIINKFKIYGCDNFNSSFIAGDAISDERAYNRLRSVYNKYEKDIWVKDLLFFVLISNSFHNQIRFNSKREFNISCGKQYFNNGRQENFKNFVNELHKINISFECEDFREFDTSNLSKTDLVYCDPPYLITEANYNDEWDGSEEVCLYKVLDELSDRGIRFALSNVFENRGKVNIMLMKWSKRYKVNYLEHNYSNCVYHAKDKSMDGTVEVLITNY